VLVWKRSLWRWHNNPCKRISLWLKSHEKKAKVGQDVQRVRLLVKKLETFMKIHFVNKLVFFKENLEYVDAINICYHK
jgi:hypothetical protein